MTAGPNAESAGRKRAVDEAMATLRAELARLPAVEKLRLLFDMEAQLYRLTGPASKEYEGGPHAKHRLIRYFDFFSSRLGDGETVLDVGCGDGSLSRAMAEAVHVQVVGCEMDSRQVDMARARNHHPRVQYHVADIFEFDPGVPVDVVVMSNVLEHLDRRVELLERLRRTSGAGRFLVRVPQFDRDWRVPLKREVGSEWRLDPTHRIEYTEEILSRELSGAGLRIVESLFRWGEIYVVATPGT